MYIDKQGVIRKKVRETMTANWMQRIETMDGKWNVNKEWRSFPFPFNPPFDMKYYTCDLFFFFFAFALFEEFRDKLRSAMRRDFLKKSHRPSFD